MFKDNLYYYLSNRYEKGSKSWEDILNDDKASKQLKLMVRNKLLKGKIEIGNKIISKTRTSIIDYVLEEFGKDVLHIDDISEIINLFLEELGLDKEEFEIDIRYLENRLSDTLVLYISLLWYVLVRCNFRYKVDAVLGFAELYLF